MGHKVHPLGFRLGIIRNWQAKWYADKSYLEFLQEDLKLRQAIESKYPEAGISQVEIERQANKVAITIHTARPGVVIGRGGQRVDEMRLHLENLVGKRVQLNIVEVNQPELDAFLVARSVADQIEHRVSFRRAMKQALFRTMQAGAKGMRIGCAGRLAGAEIARREVMHQGQVPLHTLRADIDYGLTEARTTLGRIGVKVWIYRGDILPEPSAMEIEEEAAEPVAEEKTEAVAEVKAEEKAPEPEEKPAEPVAEEKAEAVAEVKAEEKAPEPEEKPAEPVAEEKAPEPEEPVAEEKAPKAEKKTTKRKTKKTTKAKPAVSKEEKETDATAQAGEVPQES
jgi:small subunit ribosomal protein S3